MTPKPTEPKFCFITECGELKENDIGTTYFISLSYERIRNETIDLVDASQQIDDEILSDDEHPQFKKTLNWKESEKDMWNNGIKYIKIKKIKLL